MKYILLFLSLFILSGCYTTPEKEQVIVYRTDTSTVVPEAMLQRCPIVLYIDKDKYLEENLWTERERMLFDAIALYVRDIKACDNVIESVQKWRTLRLEQIKSLESK